MMLGFYNNSMKHLKNSAFNILKFLDHCDIFFKIIVDLYICFKCLYVAFYRGPYGRLVLYTKYVILLK